MRIGIMGGTLDPVHNGHIEIARSVRAELGLDGVMLLPAGDPPHKKRESDKLDRLEMAKRAAAEFDWMFVSDLEIARKGTTYTVDTLRALKRKQPDAEWIYIIGADTLNILDSWRNFPEIAQLCAFAAVSRPGVSGERPYAALLKERYGAEIIFAKASGPDISSTAIRARVAEGRSIRGLAPDSVCDYIREKGLYLCAYTWNELEVLLSERLKPARFRHTMGVAETAERLARKYGADPMRARLAGMLHDCAKSMDYDQMVALVKGNVPDLDDEELATEPVLHAPAGMLLARDEYGVRDPEILSAIRRHTLGDKNMTLLDAVIFVSDFIEPSRRPFAGLEDARAEAEKDIWSAARLCARLSGTFVESRGGKPHPRTAVWANEG